MGLRFRRSIKVLPGVRINLGKKGASLSVGGRGGTLNVGKHGVRSTVGLPGTGLSYSSYQKWGSGATPPRNAPAGRSPASPIPAPPITKNARLAILACGWTAQILLVVSGAAPWTAVFGAPVLAVMSWKAIRSP